MKFPENETCLKFCTTRSQLAQAVGGCGASFGSVWGCPRLSRGGPEEFEEAGGAACFVHCVVAMDALADGVVASASMEPGCQSSAGDVERDSDAEERKKKRRRRSKAHQVDIDRMLEVATAAVLEPHTQPFAWETNPFLQAVLARVTHTRGYITRCAYEEWLQESLSKTVKRRQNLWPTYLSSKAADVGLS